MRRSSAFALVLAGGLGLPAYAIDITTYGSSSALEDAVKSSLQGPGISINSVAYDGALGASGTFQNGLDTGLGIDQGVVLTTGDALLIRNSNTLPYEGADNGLPGKDYLDALIPGYTTYDATVVTIHFNTTGGDLHFNYAFGSEEYNEWVGSPYNDVFGFFIDGNNIALVPGTSTPVSINNVNSGSNAAYYRSNRIGDALDPYSEGTPGPYPIEYDGFTYHLNVTLTGLDPSQEHAIALAIADAGDHIYDSGVFIQAGSFSDRELEFDDVPDGGSTLALLAVAASGLILWRRKLAR